MNRKTVALCAVMTVLVGLDVGLSYAMAKDPADAVSVEVAKAVKNGELRPMPLKDGENSELQETFGKIIGKSPDSGLSAVETPKFFFGVGIIASLIGAAIKLAVIGGVAYIVVSYFKHKKVAKIAVGEEGTIDPVDILIDTVEDAISRLNKERERRKAKLERLDANFDKLKKGITRVLTKD